MNSLEGKALGSYELLICIGEGGMADVYRARHIRLNREVAIKVLPTSLAREAGFVERFEREAGVIAQMDHPNVLAIYDYGEQDGVTYLVMPLIEGGSLRDKLDGAGILPPRKVDHYLQQLASALDYAHAQGIVHRDIKPANMLLTPDDRLLLTDFGIAKVVDGTTKLTQAGTRLGTAGYMAPEQAMGKEINGRADVYALGVVLFEMLTGAMPFSGDTSVAITLQQMTAPPPSICQINPALTQALDQVVRRALAVHPEERYATAGELATGFHTVVLSASGAVTALGSAITSDELSESEPLLSLDRPVPLLKASSPRLVSQPERFGLETDLSLNLSGSRSNLLTSPLQRQPQRIANNPLLIGLTSGIIGATIAVGVLIYLLRPAQPAPTPIPYTPTPQMLRTTPTPVPFTPPTQPRVPTPVPFTPPTQPPRTAPTSLPTPAPTTLPPGTNNQEEGSPSITPTASTGTIDEP